MSKRKKSREALLKKMLSLTRKHPGIHPRKLHEYLGIEHSAGLQNKLIKRG